MADELTPAEGVEPVDPAEGTPAAEPVTPTEDWEARAKEHQAAYTQSQQELAGYREQMESLQDPEQKRQLFQQWADEFGYALPDQQEEYVDPGEQALQEAQAIRAEWEAQRQSQEEDAFWQEKSEGFIEQLDQFQEDNYKLTDAEVKAAGAQVLLAGASPEDVFKDIQATRQAGYEYVVQSKKGTFKAPKGKQGSPTLDHSNRGELEDAAKQAAQEVFTDE